MSPLYDYACEFCYEEFEAYLPVSRCDESVNCTFCGLPAKKVVTLGHGGIQRTGDSIPWVRDAAMVLNDVADDPRPNPNINTIQDLRRYYETHPNIRPAESHPALPSSYGDALYQKPDPKKEARERSKKAHKLIRRMREININTSA